jgi:chemotaxis response regulator CheB
MATSHTPIGPMIHSADTPAGFSAIKAILTGMKLSASSGMLKMTAMSHTIICLMIGARYGVIQ